MAVDVNIYDYIVKNAEPDWGGFSLKMLKDQIIGGGMNDRINVRINTYGGDANEGMAMYDYLRRLSSQGTEIHTYVEGAAYSAGSIVFLAASPENRHMMPHSEIMIHNPWTVAMGDAEQLRQDADNLDSYQNKLINIISSETKIDYDEARALLKRETYLDESLALELGFIETKMELTVLNTSNMNIIEMMQNLTGKVKNLEEKIKEEPTSEVSEDVDVQDRSTEESENDQKPESSTPSVEERLAAIEEGLAAQIENREVLNQLVEQVSTLADLVGRMPSAKNLNTKVKGGGIQRDESPEMEAIRNRLRGTGKFNSKKQN